jgi:hypothetical protein
MYVFNDRQKNKNDDKLMPEIQRTTRNVYKRGGNNITVTNKFSAV